MIFFLYNENGIFCVLIRIASMYHTIYLHVKENRKDISIMPPDLALLSTLIGSNYPCLELIFMVPKVFEPLKFYCSFMCSLIDRLGNLHADQMFETTKEAEGKGLSPEKVV